MPARLCVHLPDDAALVRVLAEGHRYTLGRAAECEIVVEHRSVSRRHASLSHDALGWRLTDLESKNGLRVGGERVSSRPLRDGQWFSIGDVFCQFELVAPEAVEAIEARASERRRTSQAWAQRLSQAQPVETLLGGLITAMVELAECRRGFLLAGNPVDGLKLAACYRLDPTELASKSFQYSTGAVDRALRDRRPIYLSNASDQSWLKDRASVLAQDLRVLACLPLIHAGSLIGAAYVDSDEDGKVLTELDAELLGAFADQAAIALAARDLQDALVRIESVVAVEAPKRASGEIAASRWAEIAAAVKSA